MTLVIDAMARCSVALRSYSDLFCDTLNINTDSVGRLAVLVLLQAGNTTNAIANKKYFMSILVDKKLLMLLREIETPHICRVFRL